MDTFPFILADAGPLVGIIFLVIWGILSLMSVANKKKRQPQRGPAGREEPVFFPEREAPQPPPPLPQWPPRLPCEEQTPREMQQSPQKKQTPPDRSDWAPRPQRRQKQGQRHQPPKPPRPPVLPAEPLAAGVLDVGDVSRTEIGSGALAAGTRRCERSRQIAGLLTPRSARQAVLLAELLSPPVALRQERP